MIGFLVGFSYGGRELFVSRGRGVGVRVVVGLGEEGAAGVVGWEEDGRRVVGGRGAGGWVEDDVVGWGAGEGVCLLQGFMRFGAEDFGCSSGG